MYFDCIPCISNCGVKNFNFSAPIQLLSLQYLLDLSEKKIFVFKSLMINLFEYVLLKIFMTLSDETNNTEKILLFFCLLNFGSEKRNSGSKVGLFGHMPFMNKFKHTKFFSSLRASKKINKITIWCGTTTQQPKIETVKLVAIS